MIGLAALIACGVHPTQARIFVDPLAAAMRRFDIITPARMAGFIGQCRVESDDFRVLEENLRYRTPEVLDRTFSAVNGLDDAARLIKAGPQAIANRVYANRNGNGDEASGDGWRYRGRGLKQLTFLANYMAAEEALARPYVAQPDLLLQPEDACLTAAWFWHTKKCNLLADTAQWGAITRAVNGPRMLKADLRQQYAEEALQVLVGGGA